MYFLIWSNSARAWFARGTAYSRIRSDAQHYDLDTAMYICEVEHGQTGFEAPILTMVPVTEEEFQRIEEINTEDSGS